jgi:hypothetical protein
MKTNSCYTENKLCFTLGVLLVNEAIFIYKQTRVFDSNVRICRCSLHNAVANIISVIKGDTNMKWICISFKEGNQFKQVYLYTNYIVKQLNKQLANK